MYCMCPCLFRPCLFFVCVYCMCGAYIGVSSLLLISIFIHSCHLIPLTCVCRANTHGMHFELHPLRQRLLWKQNVSVLWKQNVSVLWKQNVSVLWKQNVSVLWKQNVCSTHTV